MKYINELYEYCEKVGYEPTVKITSHLKYIKFTFEINKNTFKKIIFKYKKNDLHSVTLLSHNLSIKLPNYKSVTLFLDNHLKFKSKKKDPIKIKLIGEQKMYHHKNDKQNYTDYVPIKFTILYQGKEMFLIIQKNNRNVLNLFKMCSASYLYFIPNIDMHPIFDTWHMNDDNVYDFNLKFEKYTNTLDKIPKNNELTESITIAKQNSMNLIINIVNNMTMNKNITIKETTMSDMYYLSILYNNLNYYIILDIIKIDDINYLTLNINDDIYTIDLESLYIILELIYYKNIINEIIKKKKDLENSKKQDLENSKKQELETLKQELQEQNKEEFIEYVVEPSWWDYLTYIPILNKYI
ncbi:hypothetical protein Hokovirus_2_231 [Hokovirus HKV1]|uniref:Uncharacterized protein n=1 Tax=Hokovirus HKV1 TaxID=1977638 RepID=A0A1V0SGD5_9VIRU|nr:hypothetical protein Hokovirus_2_231 [Hokovirus HKV1]